MKQMAIVVTAVRLMKPSYITKKVWLLPAQAICILQIVGIIESEKWM